MQVNNFGPVGQQIFLINGVKYTYDKDGVLVEADEQKDEE